MKIAWLCYLPDSNFEIGYNPNMAFVLFNEPDKSIRYQYARIEQIVYAEVIKSC